MGKKIGKRTFILEKEIGIIGYGSVVGKKEGEGPYGEGFDMVFKDTRLGQKSFEAAESMLQNHAVKCALKRAGKKPEEIDTVCAGDLLNQCIGSSFGLIDYKIPLIGVYGACSTMALSLAMVSFLIESGCIDCGIAVTSSHFCSAERQYRFPLEYGSQRPQSAQWTVTGSGAMVLSSSGGEAKINAITIGEVTDLGVKDQNNMGAAMAPDDVKIRPYPRNEGMVFFYTQIQ